MRRSFASIFTSTSSASGSTATVTAEVCMRPLVSDHGDGLLDAAYPGLGGIENLHPPALSLCVAAVHPEHFGGEERGLVAARAGADFEDDVLLVVRVARQQEDAERLFILLQPRFEFGHLG